VAKIHPTAIVDPAAELGDDVEIGPYCIVESDVRIGAGTVLREGVAIRRYTTLGKGNFIDSHTVLGSDPQDLKFDPRNVSYTRIGDNNTFRENCSVSRATKPGNTTVIGNNTYWMIGSHAGHDSSVGDHCILINGSALAGHSELGSRALLSAHVCIHQFCWVGEMCMSQGNAIAVQHVPPYCLFAGVTDVVGLNTVGLRRNPEITTEDRRQIKEAFCLFYRSHLTPDAALERMDACTDWRPAASKFRDFIRRALRAPKPNGRGFGRLRHGTVLQDD
jgi:UDP-N-acetylglucosamine acyltransferase